MQHQQYAYDTRRQPSSHHHLPSPHGPASSHAHGHADSEFCAVCEAEEAEMTSPQRRRHQQHKQQSSRGLASSTGSQQYGLTGSFNDSRTGSEFGSYGFTSGTPLPSASTSSSLFAGSSLAALPSASSSGAAPVYPSIPTAQGYSVGIAPSPSVLAALRTLQDKLAEMRAEKAELERRLAEKDHKSSADLSEAQRRHEKALADLLAKQAEFENHYLLKLQESKEKEEQAQSRESKMEQEVRLLRDQLHDRENELHSLRNELNASQSRLHENELASARSAAETSRMMRDVEVERKTSVDAQREIERLKNEVNSYAERAHHLQVQLESSESQRKDSQRSLEDAHASLTRLAQDLKTVSKELLMEREAKEALLRFKNEVVRDYVSALLNLNYELCIDPEMARSKRNDLLKHSQELLQGLKKKAWSVDLERPGMGGGQGVGGGGGNVSASSTSTTGMGMGGGTAVSGSGLRTPPRGAGSSSRSSHDHDEQQQQYLLARASSPEVIRAHHRQSIGGNDRDHDRDRDRARSRTGQRSDEFDEDEEDGHERRSRVRTGVGLPRATTATATKRRVVRLPTTPTVASTKKRVTSASTARGSSSGSHAVSHSLRVHKDVPLPYTIGRSTKASFSVPVNVQEILAAQPAYYSKVAEMALAARRRREQGATPADDDRYIVHPPHPTTSAAKAALSSSSPSPVPLTAHSTALHTVIAQLESEVEKLNEKYISMLDSERMRASSREERKELETQLNEIIRQTENKNKQINMLRQHEESLQTKHTTRSYAAPTVSSTRATRRGTSTPAVIRAGSIVRPASARSLATVSVPSSSRRSSSRRPSTALTTTMSSSSRKSETIYIDDATDTDLTNRHAHHQHGTQTSTPKKRRSASPVSPYSSLSNAPTLSLPPGIYSSPNSQRALQRKIQSMRLLNEYKEMYDSDSGDPETSEGKLLKRFGSV